MNLPNKLTMLRVILVPVFMVFAAFGRIGTSDYDRTAMLAAGIIDPKQVSRFALQHASSVAALLLTTECAIAELPKPEPAAPAAPGMGGGMGGMY